MMKATLITFTIALLVGCSSSPVDNVSEDRDISQSSPQQPVSARVEDSMPNSAETRRTLREFGATEAPTLSVEAVKAFATHDGCDASPVSPCLAVIAGDVHSIGLYESEKDGQGWAVERHDGKLVAGLPVPARLLRGWGAPSERLASGTPLEPSGSSDKLPHGLKLNRGDKVVVVLRGQPPELIPTFAFRETKEGFMNPHFFEGRALQPEEIAAQFEEAKVRCNPDNLRPAPLPEVSLELPPGPTGD